MKIPEMVLASRLTCGPWSPADWLESRLHCSQQVMGLLEDCQTQILLSTSFSVGRDSRMLIKGLWFLTLLLSPCFLSPDEEASLRPYAKRVLGIVGTTSRFLFLTWTLVHWI